MRGLRARSWWWTPQFVVVALSIVDIASYVRAGIRYRDERREGIRGIERIWEIESRPSLGTTIYPFAAALT